MTDLEIMQKIIENIREERELAEWMLALLEAGFMDDETMYDIHFLIDKEIKKLPEGEKKTELENLFQQLSIKKEEHED